MQPGSPDEVEAKVRDDVARHGYHVAMFPPEGDTPGWAHTIGLQERFDHPEVISFGMDLSVLGPLVAEVGARVRAGFRFEPGSEADGIVQGAPIAFRSVEPKWVDAFLGNAAWHYRSTGSAGGDTGVRAVQCFWPDPRGHFPWHADVAAGVRDHQPRLEWSETHRALSEAFIAVLRDEGAL